MREQDPGIKWFNTVYYPTHRTARAYLLEQRVIPRLRETEINLFTPWGPRYSYEERGSRIKETDKEIQVIDFLRNLLEDLTKNLQGRKFNWLFLGADYYGAVVNGLPSDVVSEYFASLREMLQERLPEAELKLWSEFHEECTPYREKVANNFDYFVDSNLLRRAEETAAKMARGSAREYLIERIAEAILIEERFKPIKISCVARYKDDKVDQDLPRLYFVPETLHAPWL